MATSWKPILSHCGLQRPFNFKIAIPFLLNAAGLLVVIALVTFLLASGDLLIRTERFYFLTYIAALLLISAIISRATVLSLLIFAWCTTETCLALITNELEQSHLAESLLPKNQFTESDPRFIYHPILGFVPKPNWHGEWHSNRGNRNVYENRGWRINSEEFYRDTFFHHNSLSSRGKEPSFGDIERKLIFAYGGSTTYDLNVTQGSTWVEQLETRLKNRFTIINFGVPAHSTAQHVLHTAFYQNVLNKPPVCATYFVGANDLLNLYTDKLDPAYANSLTLALAQRKPEIWETRYSPLARLVYRKLRRRLIEAPELSSSEIHPSFGQIERIYIENIRTISAINQSRHVKTIFIGQLANRAALSSAPQSPSWLGIKNEDVWPALARFNSILKSEALLVGATYIDAGIDNFSNNDFADSLHFSATGSRKFAALISQRVDETCNSSGY